MDTYTARLLGRDRQTVAVLDHHRGFSYESEPSAITPGSITLPRNDKNVRLSQLSRYVYFYKNNVLEGTFVIVERDLSGDDDAFTLTLASEEVLLERTRTPENYGACLNNSGQFSSTRGDLASIARELLPGWFWFTVKHKEGFGTNSLYPGYGYRVGSNRVDSETLPGVVILQEDANAAFYPSGYIILRFAAVNVPGFLRWDRVRWQADYNATVKVTCQVRHWTDPATIPAWSTIPEVAGTDPGRLGYPVTGFRALGVGAPYVDIRFNLKTADTTSPDNEAAPTQYGQSPRLHAVELIARTQGAVEEGTIPASTSKTIRGLKASLSTAFDVLSQACQQAGWEFEVSQGKLNLAKELGQDRTNEVHLTTGALDRSSL